jgi:SOS-response transcriptional repressor LexA
MMAQNDVSVTGSSSTDAAAGSSIGEYFVEATGPDMTGPQIPEGAHLLVDPAVPLEDGRIVLCPGSIPAGRRYVVTESGGRLRNLLGDRETIPANGAELHVIRRVDVEI